MSANNYSYILPLEARPDFLPLPSDPRDCTPEQFAAFWGGDVNGVLVDLARDYRAQKSEWSGGTTSTPAAALIPAPAVDGVARSEHQHTTGSGI